MFFFGATAFRRLDILPVGKKYLSTEPGNTKGGSITVPFTSCLTSFGLVCFSKKIVNGHTADSKPVKQEVNGTVILPPLVSPDQTFG
jgi:hypothetical protein